MGLDVYLYTRDEHDQNERHESEWDSLYNRHEGGEITKDEYDQLREQVTEYVFYSASPSERHPEHLFDRRYLRSSYNSSGFNHAVPDLLGTPDGEYPNARGSLYWIFEPMGREWDGAPGDLGPDDLPKLRECRQRAEEVAADLKNSDRLRVSTVSANQIGGLDWLQRDDNAALAMYREHVAKGPKSSFPGSYSTQGMEVHPDGFTILAAIPGGKKRFFTDDRWPVVHLIYKAEGEGFDSYVQSAEIVAEFCDEAIMLIERDGSAYMSWSG